MLTHTDETQESQRISINTDSAQNKDSSKPTTPFLDNRPKGIAQEELQAGLDRNIPLTDETTSTEEPEEIQPFILEDGADAGETPNLAAGAGETPNNTGLPDNLKAGLESISGYSMDEVRVHFNSNKPADLQAHAYTEGLNIYIGPGQEKHLAHEAWHLVQQMQGIVRKTGMRNGVAINDDPGLEREAEKMGNQAAAFIPGTTVRNYGPLNLVQPRAMVQLMGEEILESLLSPQGFNTIATMTLSTAYLAYSWWPAGRTPLDLFKIARAIGFLRATVAQDVLALANLDTWSSANIITLATNYGTNPNGLTVPEWVAIAGNVNANDHATTTAFARMPNWTHANIVTLTTAFAANNPRNFTVAEWIAIANANAGLYNQHANVIAFARMPNWTHANIVTLATAFAANNPRGFTAAEWVAVANAHAGLYNQHANVIAFARMPNWTAVNIVTLATAFAANNPRNFTDVEWIAIANDQAGLYNQPAIAIAFATQVTNWNHAGCRLLARRYVNNNPTARPTAEWINIANLNGTILNQYDDVRYFMSLPGGWSAMDIVGLVNLFIAGNGGRNAQIWANIADAHAALHNDRVNVAAFAQMPFANWDNVNIVTLAAAFGNNNPRGFSATQWDWFANAHAALYNQPANVAAFARMANWTHANIVTLITAFAANNPNGFTAAEWIAIANAHAGLYDQHANVIAFARMANWTAGNIATLATAFAANNPNGFTTAEWIAIANAHGGLHNQHANVIAFARMANWTHANILALAQLREGGNPNNLSVANWVTLANSNAAFYDHENDVASFARIPGQTLPNIQLLVAAFLGNANGTLTQFGTFLNAIYTHNAGTTLIQITALINASPAAVTLCTHLTTLINSVAANSTVPQVTQLITAARNHNAGTTILNINALVQAAPAAANIAVHLTTLVNHVAANSTIPQTTQLIAAALNHNAGTTTLQIDALVQAIGNVANVCPELTAIVNAVAGNGTIPEMTTMVTEGVTTLGAANISDLLVPINRDNVNNTPTNLEALLIAVVPRNRVRFNTVEQNIPLFLRQAAPTHGQVNYAAAGAVTGGGATFNTNAWRFFYRRHSYEYTDFNLVVAQNSMWAPGVNTLNELNGDLPAAILAGLNPTAGAYNAQNGANNEVGTTGVGGFINHLMPLAGHRHDRYTLAEMQAIENLR